MRSRIVCTWQKVVMFYDRITGLVNIVCMEQCYVSLFDPFCQGQCLHWNELLLTEQPGCSTKSSVFPNYQCWINTTLTYFCPAPIVALLSTFQRSVVLCLPLLILAILDTRVLWPLGEEVNINKNDHCCIIVVETSQLIHMHTGNSNETKML